MRPWQRPPMTAKPSPTACSRTWIGPLSRPTGEPRQLHTRQLKARSLLIPTASITVAGYRCLPSTPKSDSPRARAGPAVPRRTPGTGRRFTLDDARDQRIEGPIPTTTERAAEIIEARSPAAEPSAPPAPS